MAVSAHSANETPEPMVGNSSAQIAAAKALESFEYNGWRPFTFLTFEPEDRGLARYAQAILTIVTNSLQNQSLDEHFHADALEGAQRLFALDEFGALARAAKAVAQ
jgi:hypothetical protein